MDILNHLSPVPEIKIKVFAYINQIWGQTKYNKGIPHKEAGAIIITRQNVI